MVSAPAAALTQSEAVAQAEQYLRGLDTLKARFVQTAWNGAQIEGTFYLNRPGKLRFEYDPPIKDFIVADGFFIYFYDGELGEQSNAPIGQTLADFLLREDLDFEGDGEIAVRDVRFGGGLWQIELIQRADPQAGSLTLGFAPDPVRLQKWRVVDAQGGITEIALSEVQTGMPLARSLFIYRAPRDSSRPTYNQ